MELFAVESPLVARALGVSLAAAHHIGSTAIPGIWAKPIIDIMVEVKDIAAVDSANGAMAALGYEAMGEYGISGRRFFRKNDSAGIRTHHVHVFEAGSAGAARHLAFRDFMRAHPDAAQKYSDLKRALAAQHPHDIEAYMNGKDSFIKTMERRALEWQNHDF